MYTLTGFGLFAIALALHLALWRVKRPARGMMTFLRISLAVFAAGLTALYALPGCNAAARFLPAGAAEFLYLMLFYFSLTAAYIMTYSAVEADSPTLVIMAAIAAAPQGVTRRELEALMTDAVLIVPRVKDLVNDKLAVEAGGRYTITPRGVRFLRIFMGYRALLRLPKGG